MAKRYAMIRVSEETADELRLMTDSVVAAHDAGRADAWWEGERPTMDEMVSALIRERQARKARVRRHREVQRNWWDAAVKEMRDAVES